MRTVSKRLRHHRILELVEREPLSTQEQLGRRLAQHGLQVTQATLSRDIKELGLVKTPGGYAPPTGAAEAIPELPPLSRMLREFVVDVRPAQNLLVLKTTPGSAQPVAAAVDAAEWSEVAGTVAGDDAILVVTSGRKACRAVEKRIREIMSVPARLHAMSAAS